MTCYEGNIAPFGLCSNMSYQHMIDLLLTGWNMFGEGYRPPTRDYVLGTGLDIALVAVEGAVETTFNPKGARKALASDGGDAISKDKIVNFNHVYDEGAVFNKIINPQGESFFSFLSSS